MGDKVKDGVYPVYVKDGTLYPILMTKEELEMFNMAMCVFNPIKVLFKYPMGNAINVVDKIKREKAE